MSALNNFESYYAGLTDTNKIRRRRALDGLLDTFDSTENPLPEDLTAILRQCEKSLISLLSDESELNRYKASRFLSKCITKGAETQNLISTIVPTLNHRLGGIPVIEDSEENRLEFLFLLEILIKSSEQNIHQYLSDISNILCKSLGDKYPDVLIQTCQIIEILSEIIKEKFQMFSNVFVHPLLRNIINQKFRVRAKAVRTLGLIFIYGDCREFLEAIPVLLKCILDIKQVKLELLTMGYSLACKMPDRYSFWPKVLPLILFGLRDDDTEIKEAAEAVWDKVGLQYEAENSDIKVDNSNVSSVQVYNPGCCALIKRGFHGMLQDIDANVHDWQTDVRIQTMRLLSACIVGLQDNCIQYADKLLQLIVLSAADQEPRVASEAVLSAEILGSYLPPDLYIRIMQPYLWSDRNEPFLILYSLLRTTPVHSLQNHLPVAFAAFSFSDIDSKLPDDRKQEILKILKFLFSQSSERHFDCSSYFTLFYIAGSLSDKEELNSIMSVICSNYKMISVDSFFEKYIKDFLIMLRESETPWVEDNPEMTVFCVLSGFRGIEFHLELVSAILKYKTEGSSDALVISSNLQSLERIVRRSASAGSELHEQWTHYMVAEHIDKLLPWKAGKTAQSLRMTSMYYLISVIEMALDSKIKIFSALQNSLNHVSHLITDELPETRNLTCRFISLVMVQYKEEFSASSFLSNFEMMSKRLDDVNPKVRHSAAAMLSLTSIDIPRSDDIRTRVETVAKEISVYLMEEDAEVRNHIVATLKQIGLKYPEELNQAVKNEELKPKGSADFLNEIDSLKNMCVS